jgi:hypothetical protein
MATSYPDVIADRSLTAHESSVAVDDKRKPNVKRAIRPLWILFVLMVFSLPFRVSHLEDPFRGEHEFRQTQTAMGVWEIREHGMSLLHPKLPLFGAPWECPMEYPVFQLAAAAVDELAPWKSLDVSIRVTSLGFFYLSAAALYLLARQLFSGPAVALFSTAVFLFSPYNIFWSRTSMIEYAATFFALAYLVAFIRWTSRPTRGLFLLCLCFGVLGCLTKITTFILPVCTAGTLAGLRVLQLLRRRPGSSRESTMENQGGSTSSSELPPEKASPLPRPLYILLLGGLLVAPVLIGDGYIKHSDRIKSQSPYTAWLSSTDPYMKAWNHGTPEQRLSLFEWRVLGDRMRGTVMSSLTVVMLLGLCYLPFGIQGFERLPGGNLWMGISLAAAPFAAILLLFNLYWVHTYYFIACAPILALWTGAGLGLVNSLIQTRMIRFCFLSLLCACWLRTLTPQAAELGTARPNDPRVNYLSEASKFIREDEPIIVVTRHEWSAFEPYYLKRRAFMAMLLDKPVDLRPLTETDYFKSNGFHWLLLEEGDPRMTELANAIMKRWKHVTAVPVPVGGAPYTFYRLSDEETALSNPND